QRKIAYISNFESTVAANLALNSSVPLFDVGRPDIAVETPRSCACECGGALRDLRLPGSGRAEVRRQRIAECQRSRNEVAKTGCGRSCQAEVLVKECSAAGAEGPEVL